MSEEKRYLKRLKLQEQAEEDQERRFRQAEKFDAEKEVFENKRK